MQLYSLNPPGLWQIQSLPAQSQCLMPRPAAANKDDVTINHLALHHAEVQTAARSLLDSFLGGTGKDAEDGTPLTLPEDTGGQIDEIEPEIHGEKYDSSFRFHTSSKVSSLANRGPRTPTDDNRPQ